MTFVSRCLRLIAIAWVILWTGLSLSENANAGFLLLSTSAPAAPWQDAGALGLLTGAIALLLVWTCHSLGEPRGVHTASVASCHRWILPVCAAGWFAFNAWQGYLSAEARLHQIAAVRVKSWGHGQDMGRAGYTALVTPERVHAELHQLLLLTVGTHLSGAVMDLGLALAMLLAATAFGTACFRHHP